MSATSALSMTQPLPQPCGLDWAGKVVLVDAARRTYFANSQTDTFWVFKCGDPSTRLCLLLLTDGRPMHSSRVLMLLLFPPVIVSKYFGVALPQGLCERQRGIRQFPSLRASVQVCSRALGCL